MNYCLGTVQFGLNYGIQGNGKPESEELYEMLSYAMRNGINILDTASAYGAAEEILGGYFKSHPEMIQRVGIVSKLKPDAFNDVDCSKWSEVAIKNAKDSLTRMGVRILEAYLFHNSKYIFDEKAVIALNAVKEEGLAKCIGVSTYSPEEAMKALDYPQITAIQIPYNVFDHRLDKCGFFTKAKEQNVLVFARSSLLQGLVMMNPDNLPDKVKFAKAYLKRFLKICKDSKLTPLETAVGYVGQKQEIDYVVFGVDNLEQLQAFLSLKEKPISEIAINRIDIEYDNVEERLINPVLWR